MGGIKILADFQRKNERETKNTRSNIKRLEKLNMLSHYIY